MDDLLSPDDLELIASAWRDASFETAPIADERIDRLLQAFDEAYANGGALLATFAIPRHPVLDRVYGSTQLATRPLLEHLLTSEALRRELPELWVDKLEPGAAFGLDSENSFTLTGQLAAHLVLGGAYDGFEGTDADAWEIAEGFREALYGRRFLEVAVLRSRDPWSPWFGNIAWDDTWVIIDRFESRLSVLAVTDTD